MSGRSAPSSVRTCTCSAKSQCSTMPASSASRRSVSSPHWPRTSGRRSALTSERVSFCSACCPIVTDSIELLRLPNVSARSFSMRCICCSVLFSASRIGATQRLDGLLTLHQHGGGVLVVLAQVLARQLQEHFVVRAHRRAGDGVEAGAQPLDGLVERSLPLAIDLLVGLDLRAHDRELQVQRFALAPAAPGRSEDADQHADEQADERRGDDGSAHWRASASSAGRRRCIM